MPAKKVALKAKLHHVSGESHPQRCSLLIQNAGSVFGNIVVELCTSEVPKACEMFLQGMSNNEKNRGKQSTYKLCPLKRLTKIGLQTGETNPPAKTVSLSELENEIGKISHGYGVLSFCRYLNGFDGSQFFFCLSTDPIEIDHLNKKHVAFGKIVGGIDVLENLVTALEGYIEEDGIVDKSCPFVLAEVSPTLNDII